MKCNKHNYGENFENIVNEEVKKKKISCTMLPYNSYDFIYKNITKFFANPTTKRKKNKYSSEILHKGNMQKIISENINNERTTYFWPGEQRKSLLIQ